MHSIDIVEMTNYKCEDFSLCENFQAAICLYCDHRLCVRHIIEHEKNVFGDVKKLCDLIEITFQEIKDKSDKSKITYNDLLSSCGEWRTQELEKFEQINENEWLLIRNEGEALEDFHRDLSEQVERDARQQNINIEMLNHIRQTIGKIRKECVDLKWEVPTPSPVNTEYSPSDFPSILSPVQIPTAGNKLIQKQSTTNEKASPRLSSTSTTSKAIKLKKNRPRKRLVRMFGNISSIIQSTNDIASYTGDKKLLILVNAYLTACHQKSKPDEKLLLLNEYISTIKKYLENRSCEFDVLIGIQTFFFNNTFEDEKSEIMRFLLQFFLDHQCISQTLIVDWFNNQIAREYEGFEEAKQLAKPFIEAFSTIDTVKAAIEEKMLSTSKTVQLKTNRPRKRLVRMFGNISSIKQSKDDIASYKGNKKLLMLVNAYLTAWYRKSKASEKSFLLDEHISTIQQYKTNRKSDFDVLIAIQAFFFNEQVRENKYEMMTFLLQFFLNHQCLSQNLILEWYNKNNANGYMGYEEAKQLAGPFVNSLLTKDTDKTGIEVNNIQATST